MKILLDKCTNESIRYHFPDQVVHTARYLGWSRLTNGELLDKAEQAGYDLLISADNDMRYTQNLSRRRISVLFIQQNTALSDDFIEEIRAKIDVHTAGGED